MQWDLEHNKYDIVCNDLAYWFTGYITFEESDKNLTPPCYGIYIDWKEERDEIIEAFKKPIRNLGYPLNFKNITFTGKEFTHEVLHKINQYCLKEGYSLVSWDTMSDSYHLFVIKEGDLNRLLELGDDIGIRFLNEYC